MLIDVIENCCIELADEVNSYNQKQGIDKRVTADNIIFDCSRSWSLYINGEFMDLSCRKFGAYRGYMGGGVRGEMEHNGRDQDGTTALGNFFAKCLRKIEAAYNEEYTPDACESWEQATGVLL